jgi:hypothetical protein
MTIFTFANNVNTTLASAVSSSATSITLASTANLPASIPAGTVLVITLNDAATRQNFEIVYATARAGATLTVLRAQEGTAALSWLTGDFAYSPPTAGQQASFTQLAEFQSSLGTNGYKEIPDPNSASGYYIEQFGNANFSGSSVNVTFPIAFPNAVRSIVVTESGAGSWSTSNVSFYGVSAFSTSSFSVAHFEWAGSGVVAGTGGNFFWHAVGY